MRRQIVYIIVLSASMVLGTAIPGPSNTVDIRILSIANWALALLIKKGF